MFPSYLFSPSGDKQTEIQDWNELIADLVKFQTRMLNKEQNSKDLLFLPSWRGLHNCNLPT